MKGRWSPLVFAMESVGGTEGCWAEFGVASGKSTRVILEHMPQDRALYLFDSWEGLPEKWESGHHKAADQMKGRYACPVPDFQDDRVVIHKGMFADTLPLWDPKEKVAFVHIDCDLYSSTSTVLKHLKPLLVPGSILCFDEIAGGIKYEGERKAWDEAKIPHEVVFKHSKRYQMVMRVA